MTECSIKGLVENVKAMNSVRGLVEEEGKRKAGGRQEEGRRKAEVLNLSFVISSFV